MSKTIIGMRSKLRSAAARGVLALAGLAALTVQAPAVMAAGDFPAKPIEFWIPFPPGGPTDGSLRTLANAAGKELKHRVVPINKPGAGATLAAQLMSQTAAPDGYTLSMVAANIFRMPHLQKTPYDPLKDFTYIIGLTNYRYGLVVRADARWKTLEEFLAYARANPGKVTYGAVGIGSSGHISMEKLGKAAGAKFTFVPYKGGSEEMMALLSGDIDAVLDPGWGQHAVAGKVRPLAIVGDARFPRFKDVPTLKERGYDITASSLVGIVGPKGMDPAVVRALHDAFYKASQDPAYLRSLEAIDLEQVHLSSEAYARFAAEQYEREKASVRQLEISLQ
ncbi:tripartite tricarboxylate transporter substrate binding protein [Cupriavidus consociatus]|uniref:tripartite tricarboxylate transporter substrate binding protein n=1 Tax=Cupriavidus consociatus TaxID=2821357 RepID=UPI0024DFABE0|nr:tripartite tricarboxylate transporter substrate binding protein [Cupriavidus sp. LEh21]MDK2656018.1 tripartite tricarboxylate transporter substrate binding protein [Cupriavidus sp. LEh21]